MICPNAKTLDEGREREEDGREVRVEKGRKEGERIILVKGEQTTTTPFNPSIIYPFSRAQR